MNFAYCLAYGALLNEHTMHRICPDACCIKKERLYGYSLAFRGPHSSSSQLTLIADSKGSTSVVIWKIPQSQAQELIEYEKNPPIRELSHMVVDGIHCLVFLIDPRYPFCTPDDSYLKQVQEGYQENGFDLMDLKQAFLAR